MQDHVFWKGPPPEDPRFADPPASVEASSPPHTGEPEPVPQPPPLPDPKPVPAHATPERQGTDVLCRTPSTVKERQAAARAKQAKWKEANREKHRVRERERMREKRAALKAQKLNTPGAEGIPSPTTTERTP
jgi:protein TonB